MLVLLSPAKSLNYESKPLIDKATRPRFAEHSYELVNILRELDPEMIGKLMHISPKLATLNYDRYQNYRKTPTKDNSRQAILAFTGDVYRGMTLDDWSADDFDAVGRRPHGRAARQRVALDGVVDERPRYHPHPDA